MTVATMGRIKNEMKATILPPCAAVIDGRIGFTGGAGIADHWTGDAKARSEYRLCLIGAKFFEHRLQARVVFARKGLSGQDFKLAAA